MLEIVLGIVCLVVLLLAGFQYKSHRGTKEQLKEYKALFEVSSQESKVARDKVEGLLEVNRSKDVLLERGAAAIEVANAKLQEQLRVIQQKVQEIDALQETVRFQDQQYGKLLGQKKSSEVRTGMITEQIAPFLADYPLDPKTARFLGDPIDFCHFLDDKIVFVEVKTGKSQLNKRQREIRDLIKAGKVEFTIYRVEGKPK